MPRLVLSLLLVMAACSRESETTPAPSPTPTAISWERYGPEAFARAEAEGKLVLLDVGIEGCTACRWMFEGTYANDEVIRRVERDFVAVTVDASTHPDLRQRYAAWAWPATVFLRPDGEQLMALRGNKRPRNFLPALDRVLAIARGEQPPQAVADAHGQDLPFDAACDALTTRIDAFSHGSGGWGRGPRRVQGPLARWSLMQSDRREDALVLARHYQELLDPVWGGVFTASRDGWAQPIVEKRLEEQAQAVLTFAHAYAATGDARWLEAVQSVAAYVHRFLTDRDGGFYASQQDEAPGLAGMTAEAYFGLDDSQRRARGVPPVDQGVYSDLNAQMVFAYAEMARLYEARQRQALAEGTEGSGVREGGAGEGVGEAEGVLSAFVERARHGGQRLMARVRDGVLSQLDHTSPDGPQTGERARRLRGVEAAFGGPILETQAQGILAMTALYDLTGESSYLTVSRVLADVALDQLQEPDGAFVSSRRPDVLTPDRPPSANARMARALLRLADRAHEFTYADAAVKSLRFATSHLASAGPTLLGELALAHQERSRGLIQVSIAAAEDDAQGAVLLAAAWQGYAPSRRAGYDEDHRYPRGARAAAFVCTRDSCSRPMETPQALRAYVREAADAPACAGE